MLINVMTMEGRDLVFPRIEDDDGEKKELLVLLCYYFVDSLHSTLVNSLLLDLLFSTLVFFFPFLSSHIAFVLPSLYTLLKQNMKLGGSGQKYVSCLCNACV